MIDLKKMRKSRGYTQKDIANFLGIKQQQYARYETKVTKITLEYAEKIASICNYKILLKKQKK